MLTYASSDDLTNWDATITQPDNVTALLRSASALVAKAVNENPYDPATVITDPKRDATCAQVAAWLAAGVTPGTAGLSTSTTSAPKKAVKTDSAEVQYDTTLSSSAAALTARAELLECLCPEAMAILQQAGVLWFPLAVLTVDPPSPCGPYSPLWRPSYADGYGWGSWPYSQYGPAYLNQIT